MNELYAFLDTHGLSISFSRLPAGGCNEPWMVMIVDLRYETPGSNSNSICEMDATMEGAVAKCWEAIRTRDVFKVVRDTTERKVPVPKPEAAHV